jgi:hypothetical protein
MSGRKTRVTCRTFVDGNQTAEADVVAVRVFEGEPTRGEAFR